MPVNFYRLRVTYRLVDVHSSVSMNKGQQDQSRAQSDWQENIVPIHFALLVTTVEIPSIGFRYHCAHPFLAAYVPMFCALCSSFPFCPVYYPLFVFHVHCV